MHVCVFAATTMTEESQGLCCAAQRCPNALCNINPRVAYADTKSTICLSSEAWGAAPRLPNDARMLGSIRTSYGYIHTHIEANIGGERHAQSMASKARVGSRP